MPRTRVRPTRQQTIERLLDGAADVFAARGFHGATVDEICAKAGFTRGAYYSSFGSKEELFLALSDRVAAELTASLRQALQAVDTIAETSWEDGVEGYLQRRKLDPSWSLLDAEVNLHAARNPAFAVRLAQHSRAHRELLAGELREHLKRHDIKLRVDLDLLVRAFLALGSGGWQQALIEPEALKPEELLRTFAPLLVHGAIEGP